MKGAEAGVVVTGVRFKDCHTRAYVDLKEDWMVKSVLAKNGSEFYTRNECKPTIVNVARSIPMKDHRHQHAPYNKELGSS